LLLLGKCSSILALFGSDGRFQCDVTAKRKSVNISEMNFFGFLPIIPDRRNKQGLARVRNEKIDTHGFLP